MNIDFYNTFIDIPFDSLLEQHNSILINSTDLYLNYKQIYLKKTRENLDRYLKENKILKDFSNLQLSTNDKNTKFNYIFIDTDKFKKQKQVVKNIILDQRELYKNFEHYVNNLLKTQKIRTKSIKSNMSNRSTDKKSKFSLFSKTIKKK